MTLLIDTDWPEESRARTNRGALQRCVFNDTCTEERWYNCFARHIQPHQKLDSLFIILENWRDPDKPDCIENWMMQRQEDADTLATWRNSLINMWEYYVTGIKKVVIVSRDDDELGLVHSDLRNIAGRMMRDKYFEEQRPVKIHVPLEELLLRAQDESHRERVHLAHMTRYF